MMFMKLMELYKNHKEKIYIQEMEYFLWHHKHLVMILKTRL